jgi:putative tricarboxylic transport membrane protein
MGLGGEDNMLKKYGDLISGIFLLILSAALFLGSFTVKMLTVSRIGSAFVPQVVAVLLAIASISIIFHSINALRKGAITEQDEKKQCAPEAPGKMNFKGLIGTLVLLVAYIATLAPVGFLISTTVYLFFQMFVLATKEQRKLPLFLVISILTSTAVYYTFLKVFNLMLPAGILG